MPKFRDSWKRLERAAVHAKAFTTGWSGLLPREAYALSIAEREAGRFVALARLIAPVENDLALELGEYFYQLRAALDGVVYKFAADVHAPSPPPCETSIEFPIYNKNNGKFERNAMINGPYPKELKDWLRNIQPFNLGSSTYSSWAEFSRRLLVLHDCARKDRHRRLHVVAAVPTSVHWEFDFCPGLTFTKVKSLHANLFDQESEFLEFYPIGEVGADTQIRLHTKVAVNLSVAEMPGLVGQEVVGELEKIANMVALIIEWFETST